MLNTTKQVSIRFYAELNDFLPPEKRFKTFTVNIFGAPTVKDVIESLGVPHPEIDLILVDNNPVAFEHHLEGKERVAVYPVFELFNIGAVNRLRAEPLRNPRFILDVNLGKLARKLRMLGFDSLYDNGYDDRQIIAIAKESCRIILTRDVELLKHGQVQRGYWVRSTDSETQIEEVITKFDLFESIKSFSICLDCNGTIQEASKAEIYDSLPEQTRQSFNEFFRCLSCGKIYWKGSHYEHMMRFIRKISTKQRNRPL